MLNLGIVGTGLMAGVIAEACLSANIKVHSVLSRSLSKAQAFCGRFGLSAERGYTDTDRFFADHELDAVYIATPTSSKIALLRHCLAYGKHALIEKPFPDSDNFLVLLSEADNQHLVWLDATHFIHNPSHADLHQEIEIHVGEINRISASFIWPDSDKGQIKFDPELEPDGALGDLGWYPIRMISEFIDSQTIRHCSAFLLENKRHTIIEASLTGLTKNNVVITATASYRGSVCSQSCTISGSQGQLHFDDFVMPYCGSFVYGTMLPTMNVRASRGLKPLIDNQVKAYEFHELQHVSMLKNFAQYVRGADMVRLHAHQKVCRNTLNMFKQMKISARKLSF